MAKPYTPVRQFYAWVGFVFLTAAAIAAVGLSLWLCFR